MAWLIKYVLVKDIMKHEKEGWKLSSDKVVLKLGDWSTVLMEREVN